MEEGCPPLNGGIQTDDGQWVHRRGRGRNKETPRHECVNDIQAHRRPRRRRRQTGHTARIAYLNIQGGRSRSKWEEIFQALEEENLLLYGVAESHLRESEVPPGHPKFCWEGCNREAGERRGGGVGVLFRPDLGWSRVRPECREHLWLAGCLSGQKTAVAVVYMWCGQADRAQNERLWGCLREDIRCLETEHQVLLLGDFNGHLEDLGGVTDRNGQELLDTMDRHQLVLANLQHNCEGQVTWSSGDRSSAIDFAVMSPGLYEKLERLVIDEGGSRSLGSDHNRLLLMFGGKYVSKDGAGGRKHLTEQETQNIAQRLEERPELEYSKLVQHVQDEKSKNRRGRSRRTKHGLKSWWGTDVRSAIQERKAACRLHRRAVRAQQPEPVRRQLWDSYREKKKVAAGIIQDNIRQINQKFIEELKRSGREAPRKFWQHVQRSHKHAESKQQLRHPETQQLLSEADSRELMVSVVAALFKKERNDATGGTEQEGTRQELTQTDASGNGQTGTLTVDLEEWLGSVGETEWKHVLQSIPTRTATGLDGFPATLLKLLGPKQCQALRDMFDTMLETGQVPEEWGCSRMMFIPKGTGDRSSWKNYRPITVTSVLYRVFTQILRRRIQAWAEREGVLGELQNGFRRGRRLDDNLYVLTQCIEVARLQRRELWAAFLDVEKAYDSVDHAILWYKLQGKGLPEEVVRLLRRLYAGNEVVVEWQGVCSQPVPVERGLRQGCPLSPLLFMLLLSDLEVELEGSTVGFDLTYMEQGRTVQQRLPGLMYADDIVLTAGSPSDLQRLLHICSKHAELLGLRFGTQKCAVLRWGNTGTLPDGDALTVQGKPIPFATTYRYLGVDLTTEPDYLAAHERKLRGKALRNQNVLRARILWTFNRMEVIRSLWKMVHVPALTFANAVLCLSSATREYLERRQREVGRLALGAHRSTPNEAVQGDVGWSSFEAREAVAKLGFEIRAWSLRDTHWVLRVHRCMLFSGETTKWKKRVRALAHKNEVPLPALNNLKETSLTRRQLRERVVEAETRKWAEKAAAKTSLRLYSSHKHTIAKEGLYDNLPGSAMLFEARAGVLRTRMWRRRWDEGVDLLCAACGEDEESTEHIVLMCQQLSPQHPSGTTMEQALGFVVSLPQEGAHDTSDSTEASGALTGRAASSNALNPVDITKRRLAEWRRHAR